MSTSRISRSLLALAAASLLAFAGLAPGAIAKNGADDPAGHNARDDHGGKVTAKVRTARHRADDPAGDDRGGHRADDGPNHR
jgi:hypothetical protein